MTSDKLHSTVVTATSGEELGRQIMQMRYDEVLKVLQGMQREAQLQSINDEIRGRHQLAAALKDVHHSFRQVNVWMKEAVQICQPYIDHEKHNVDECHSSHVTRSSDASSYDFRCINCGATDEAGVGWGRLRFSCPKST